MTNATKTASDDAAVPAPPDQSNGAGVASPAGFRLVEAIYARRMDLRNDSDILRILMGTIVANRLDGDPVWIILAANSGGGKTALVSGMMDTEWTEQISTFTTAAFASGTTGASILDEWNGKTVIMTDFSTVSSMPKDKKAEIYSIFRDTYDGHYVRATGRSDVNIEWRGKYGVIACYTTAGVELDVKTNAELGERFLIVRMRSNDVSRKQAASMAYESRSRKDQIEETRNAVIDYIDRTKNAIPKDPELPESMKEIIINAATAMCLARSSASRDTRTHEILVPMKDSMESPGRVTKQLRSLALGLWVMGFAEDDVTRMIRRVCSDSIPSVKLKILQCYRIGISTHGSISKAIGIPKSVVQREDEELRQCKLIWKDPRTRQWVLDPDIETIISRDEEDDF